MKDDNVQRRDHSLQSGSATIRLFVYGTLRRGYRNHDQFCEEAISIEPAMVWGRLYHLSFGFPAIEVPGESVLAHGTAYPLIDAGIQAQLTTGIKRVFSAPYEEGDWDLITGEIVSFNNPESSLPPIDRLEGFYPSSKSLYRRVLVASQTLNGTDLPVWLYEMPTILNGTRIKHEWKAH